MSASFCAPLDFIQNQVASVFIESGKLNWTTARLSADRACGNAQGLEIAA
jgi:hypothetical protein